MITIIIIIIIIIITIIIIERSSYNDREFQKDESILFISDLARRDAIVHRKEGVHGRIQALRLSHNQIRNEKFSANELKVVEVNYECTRHLSSRWLLSARIFGMRTWTSDVIRTLSDFMSLLSCPCYHFCESCCRNTAVL